MFEDIILYAEINDSYTFKSMIEYLKGVSSEGNFIFRKDSVLYEQEGLDKKMLSKIELLPYNMCNYVYKSTAPEIIFGFDTKELLTPIKTATKKDSLTLFMTAKENVLQLQLHGPKANTSSRENIIRVMGKNVNLTTYSRKEYSRSDLDATCKVPTATFSEICKGIQNAKYEYVIVKGFPNGILIRNVQSDGRINTYEKLGDVDCDISKLLNVETVKSMEGGNMRLNVLQKLEPDEIRLGGKIFAALVKLKNISGVGIIHIYMENGLPLKLVTNVGLIGKLTIYLR